MKLIGISASKSATQTFVNSSYPDAFQRDGVTPVILPIVPIENRETIDQEEFNALHHDRFAAIAQSMAGLVLSGGVDLNSLSFGDRNYASAGCDGERDMTELALLDAFLKAGKPILGVCRGFQLCLRSLGATNFSQDLDVPELHNGNDREFKNRQEPAHKVYLLGEFKKYVREKTGKPGLNSLDWNSFHHQAYLLGRPDKIPKNLPQGGYGAWLGGWIAQYEDSNQLKIIGCTDYIIEAVEKKEIKFVGYANHPEEYGPKGLAIQYWLDSYVL